MKMNLKDFDYKQFLIEKGERIALGVAVAIALLLVGFGFIVRTARSVGGPDRANLLDEFRKKGEGNLARSEPKPDLGVVPPDLIAAVNVQPLDPSLYQVPYQYFYPPPPEDVKWRKPLVEAPDEFDAQVVRTQVMSYWFINDFKQIMVRVPHDTKDRHTSEEADKELAKSAGRRYRAVSGRNNQLAAALLAARRGAAGGEGGGPAAMNQSRNIPLSGAANWEIKPVDLDKVEDVGAPPAMQVIPYRMVVVSAAFPYRKQIEDFRRALRYSSVADMFGDKTHEPVIEFTGLNVKRRTLSLDGRQVKKDWEVVDLEGAYKQMRFLAVATQPEDEEMKHYGVIVTQIPATRLVRPLPYAAHGAQYPKPDLPSLAKTLEEQKKAGVDATKVEKKKSRFNPETFDEDAEAGMPGSKSRAVASSNPGGEAATKPASANANQEADVVVPEKCLARFIDVTVRPGFCYEYQVQVKMANPTYGRRDLALSEKDAEQPEILGEFRTVTARTGDANTPLRVAVDGDTQFYAVDERPDRLVMATVTPTDRLPVTNERTAIQIQRWLDQVPIRPDQPESLINVGEWLVVERTVAYRGDYIGGVRDEEVPWWDPKLEKFVFANQMVVGNKAVSPARGRKGVRVDFNTGDVLIDFDGGKRTYNAAAPAAQRKVDESPVEVLVLTPDGKLVVRNSQDDTEDKVRKERLEAWKARLQQVRSGAEEDIPGQKKSGGMFKKEKKDTGDSGGGGG